MESNSFEILDLSTLYDFKNYQSLCAKINNDNPFFKFDLSLNNNSSRNQIKYFLLSKNNKPIIIMAIIVRQIFINESLTEFKDVISPYGYSGPLISENTSEIDLKQFWHFIDLWYKENNIITEFIRFSLDNNTTGYNGTIIPALNNVCGEILEENEQWLKFDKKVRNNFRKAFDNQLSFKIHSNKIESNVVAQFYNIYKDTMIRRNADIQLYFSLGYFENYSKANPNHCAIAMVYKDDVPISTEFLLLSKDNVYSYLGGTNSEYFNFRPNDFLKVNVINWSRMNNFKNYILGGGRIDNDNLYTYKKSFFPKEKDLVFYTGRKILNQKIYDELNAKTLNSFVINNSEIVDFFPTYRKSYNSISI
jgi:hypothetical protein